MQKIRAYRSRGLVTLMLVLCILWAMLIFVMSAEPATASADRSGSITEKVVSLVISEYEDLPNAERVSLLSRADHLIRKFAHFCIYGVLGMLIISVSLGYPASGVVHVIRTTFAGTLYAVTDEIHQYFVPGRGPKVTDVMIDGAGVLCGALFVMNVFIVCLRRKERKNGT